MQSLCPPLWHCLPRRPQQWHVPPHLLLRPALLLLVRPALLLLLWPALLLLPWPAHPSQEPPLPCQELLPPDPGLLPATPELPLPG
ncbi:hypothetical protein F751_5671 [Auxenochlorella protothecoides]|uniref:Uncharacterized protein n=1 Tax=Auxenochlorella protothecoides TaxID=3075 RepID=A0A087SPQ3_AUXPR|nr:hypothetical protein F751_5671 [Auxenochlorella protothecoides]KFM27707.1 hypothetical protein F751_5671 [Auxenochlorella protothecoides]